MVIKDGSLPGIVEAKRHSRATRRLRTKPLAILHRGLESPHFRVRSESRNEWAGGTDAGRCNIFIPSLSAVCSCQALPIFCQCNALCCDALC